MSPSQIAVGSFVLSVLVNAGILVLAKKAFAALLLQELSNHFPKVEDFKRDMGGMSTRVDRAEAAATLAIGNADRALTEVTATRALLDRHHERVMQDFVEPLHEQTKVLQEMGKALAGQASEMEHNGKLLLKLLDRELK